MEGRKSKLLEVLDGANKRFIIPVYQRNYDWKIKHCARLYDDLIKTYKEGRGAHFFGSIVRKAAHSEDFLVIDGQQRITTVSLLFAAMVKLLESGEASAKDDMLSARIKETYLVDRFRKEERKLRLKPIKDDCAAFDKIFDEYGAPLDEKSNITANYRYFCERIKRQEIAMDDLFDAIGRLEVIDITLEDKDDPQLIFESLNSTGLDLTEGDKIRNFILMSLDDQMQERYYNKYWNAIERLTRYDVSEFIRHYLTIKQRRIPKVGEVYAVFRAFVTKEIGRVTSGDCESILREMLEYAKVFNEIITASIGKGDNIACILCRLARLEMTVAYPLLMSVLLRFERGDISESEAEGALVCVESFVVRRMLCGSPSNALNKIFCTLDADVMEQLAQNRGVRYDACLTYLLEAKTASGAFPKDDEVARAIAERDVFHLPRKMRDYLFERFENGDSVERVNVAEMLHSKDGDTPELSIEHIMPQTLTAEWKDALGKDWSEIYSKRLHTLPNLTLTGYNSRYSNRPFKEKRDMEKGFRDSALNMNKCLLDFDKWTAAEMDKRQAILTDRAKNLWPYPATGFVPKKKIADSVPLADVEPDDMTGRKLLSYKYCDDEAKNTYSWVEMFTGVAARLCDEDTQPMRHLAESTKWVSLESKEGDTRYVKAGVDIYVYKATSTETKIGILKRMFDEYGKDAGDLVFTLVPKENTSVPDV